MQTDLFERCDDLLVNRVLLLELLVDDSEVVLRFDQASSLLVDLIFQRGNLLCQLYASQSASARKQNRKRRT